MKVETTEKKSMVTIFLDECAKGFGTGVKTIIPAMILGYTLVYVLQATGLMDILAVICAPIMGLLGLPGESITVLISAFFSKASGCAAAAMLFEQGVLTGAQATMLYPACILMGTLIGHFSRVVLVTGAEKRWHGLMLAIPVIDAIIAMIVTRIILSFMGLM